MAAAFKRNRVWINPAFQLRVLGRLAYYFLAYAVVVWVIGFVMAALRSLYTNGAGQNSAQIAASFLWEQRPLLIAFIGVTPFFVLDLIRFSHRVAGPLHRCRSMMREMAEGKAVPEFKPRKHDLMPELFEDFNALVKAWNARLAAANGHAGGVNGVSEPHASAPQAAASPPGV